MHSSFPNLESRVPAMPNPIEWGVTSVTICPVQMVTPNPLLTRRLTTLTSLTSFTPKTHIRAGMGDTTGGGDAIYYFS